MMRFSSLIVLMLLLPYSAHAEFPINLKQCLDDMPVMADAGEVGGQAFVNVKNFEHKPVFCEAHFKNGPEQKTRRLTIKPGKNGTMTFSPRRVVARMYVTLYCSDDKERLKDKDALGDSCFKARDQ